MKRSIKLAPLALAVPTMLMATTGPAFATHIESDSNCPAQADICTDSWHQAATGTVNITIYVRAASVNYTWHLYRPNGTTQCYGTYAKSAPATTWSCTGVAAASGNYSVVVVPTAGAFNPGYIHVQHN